MFKPRRHVVGYINSVAPILGCATTKTLTFCLFLFLFCFYQQESEAAVLTQRGLQMAPQS